MGDKELSNDIKGVSWVSNKKARMIELIPGQIKTLTIIGTHV